MRQQERLLHSFLSWWTNSESVPNFSECFADDIRYHMEPVGLADRGAIWLVEQSLDWGDVEVLKAKLRGDTGYLAIEGTDPVTGLRHRIRWELVIEGEKILSVLEHSEILDELA